MGIIKRIQKKQQERQLESAIRYGFILLGFNFALLLALFFALIGTTTLVSLLNLSSLMFLFLPLVAIFVFAGASAIIWYRFGQILRVRFKHDQLTYSSLVVLISIVPLFLLLIFLSALLGVWATATTFFVTAFIGTIFITILAVLFEVPVVVLGVMTKS